MKKGVGRTGSLFWNVQSALAQSANAETEAFVELLELRYGLFGFLYVLLRPGCSIAEIILVLLEELLSDLFAIFFAEL